MTTIYLNDAGFEYSCGYKHYYLHLRTFNNHARRQHFKIECDIYVYERAIKIMTEGQQNLKISYSIKNGTIIGFKVVGHGSVDY
jgi:hypothetical protein